MASAPAQRYLHMTWETRHELVVPVPDGAGGVEHSVLELVRSLVQQETGVLAETLRFTVTTDG